MFHFSFLCCDNAVVRFRHKKHSVRVRKRSRFGLKYSVLLPQHKLENVTTSRKKYLVMLSQTWLANVHLVKTTGLIYMKSERHFDMYRKNNDIIRMKWTNFIISVVCRKVKIQHFTRGYILLVIKSSSHLRWRTNSLLLSDATIGVSYTKVKVIMYYRDILSALYIHIDSYFCRSSLLNLLSLVLVF